MPFDGTDFPRGTPPRRSPSDTAVSVAIVAIAIALLVTPISLAALVDLIRFLRSSG